jgi:hypothetical protein
MLSEPLSLRVFVAKDKEPPLRPSNLPNAGRLKYIGTVTLSPLGESKEWGKEYLVNLNVLSTLVVGFFTEDQKRSAYHLQQNLSCLMEAYHT